MSDFSIEHIRIARERLAPHVVRTPVLSSPMLDRELGCELFVKAESLQNTGTFKFRGALNKILTLSREQLRRGVVAYSSGNHGHGVAAAAKIAGTSAVIVLPNGAAAVKVESCRWWGAKIVTYDPATESREEIARPFIEASGMTLVPPFDDHDVMAGQGTAGLELCERLIELGMTLDAIVIPSSGGGLSSGVITAVHEFFPRAECYIVEPQGYDKMARSLARGERVSNAHEARTVMDALVGRFVGERTFEVLRRHAVTALSVSDDESLEGVRAGARYLKLVLEPGGAAALAALVTRKIEMSGKRVAVICSGSNIDPATLVRALQAAPVKAGHLA